MDPSQDPLSSNSGRKVSDNNRALIEEINGRLRLVAQLKSYEDSRGYDFLDPQREESMLRDVSRSNRGPSRRKASSRSTRRFSTSRSERSLDR
jgi:chorismate mutase